MTLQRTNEIAVLVEIYGRYLITHGRHEQAWNYSLTDGGTSVLVRGHAQNKTNPITGNGHGRVTDPDGDRFSGRNLGMIPY